MKRVSFIVPEGDFQITSFGDVLTTCGISAADFTIEEVSDEDSGSVH